MLENAGTFNVRRAARFYLGYNPYWNGRRQHDQERYRRDVRLPERVDALQGIRHERVRERGHAGADGHHRDDQHPGRGHQTGTVSVKTGTLEFSGGLTNLSAAGTLTGGTYEVDAGSSLQLPNNSPIVTDDADIILSGAGSTIEDYNTASGTYSAVDQTLRTIGAAGELRLLADRNWTTADAAITNDGVIQLGGGTLTSTNSSASLTDGAGSKLVGFGTVTATTLANSGTIEASGGKLTLMDAVTGAGALQVDAGADLILAGTTATTNAAKFNGAGATLTLNHLSGLSGSIGGFGLDDVIDLVGITANGASVNASNQLVVTEGGTTVAKLQLSGDNSGFYFLNLAGERRHGRHLSADHRDRRAGHHGASFGDSGRGPGGHDQWVGLAETGSTVDETFTVTLADTNGVLSASGSGVSGAGTTSLTITGSLTQVNADLATLTDTDGVTGSDTITLNASDSLGGAAAQQQIAVMVYGRPSSRRQLPWPRALAGRTRSQRGQPRGKRRYIERDTYPHPERYEWQSVGERGRRLRRRDDQPHDHRVADPSERRPRDTG